MVSTEVVEALYRALLGHPADTEGLEFWSSAESAEVVIQGLVATENARDRFARLLGAAQAGATVDAAGLLAAVRLEAGRGLTELSDLPVGVAVHRSLEVLPWDAVCHGIQAPQVAVIGQYATELAAELERRVPRAVARPGHLSGESHICDVLILTRSGDLAALRSARPDLVRGVRRRLFVPVTLDARVPQDEIVESLRSLRSSLHGLGFMQVRHLLRLRFSAVEKDLGTSFSLAVPGEFSGESTGRLEPASGGWLVADRVAQEDDR